MTTFKEILDTLKKAINDGKVQGTDQIHYIEITFGGDTLDVIVNPNSDGSKDICIVGGK